MSIENHPIHTLPTDVQMALRSKAEEHIEVLRDYAAAGQQPVNPKDHPLDDKEVTAALALSNLNPSDAQHKAAVVPLIQNAHAEVQKIIRSYGVEGGTSHYGDPPPPAVISIGGASELGV